MSLHHGSVERAYAVEAHKIILLRCWVSSTIMIPRTSEEKFQHHGCVERVLRYGSIEDVLIHCWVSSTRMIPRIRE